MRHELAVIGAPRVILPHRLYERCLGWMKAAQGEVSWRGLADWNEQEIRISEIFLPFQQASIAAVGALKTGEGGDFSRWVTESIKNGSYTNSRGECRYKWHMHKHPGNGWLDLFESLTDEANTARFVGKDVDWMIVGRGVDSGKFRVCLEIFQPCRLAIDHLPVYVEFNGCLFQVSEPDRVPIVDGGVALQLASPALLNQLKEDGKDYYGNISVSIRENPPTPIYPIYTNISSQSLPAAKSVAGGKLIPRVRKKRRSYLPPPPDRWRVLVNSVRQTNTASGVYCRILRLQGMVHCDLHLRLEPWALKLPGLIMSQELPELSDVRAEADREVARKVSFTSISVTGKKTKKGGSYKSPAVHLADPWLSSAAGEDGGGFI